MLYDKCVSIKKNGIQIWKKEIKMSLFPHDMILYVENPNESTEKIL